MTSQLFGNSYYAWTWRTDHFIVGTGKSHAEAIGNALTALTNETTCK